MMIVRDKLYIGGNGSQPSDPRPAGDPFPARPVACSATSPRPPTPTSTARSPRPGRRSTTARGRRPPRQRQAVIRRLNALREARADEIAAAISAENGSALWFTKVGQPFLTRQVTAYLKARPRARLGGDARAVRPRRRLRHHRPPRADRRGRRRDPVELAVLRGHREADPRPAGGQHRGAEGIAGELAEHDAAGRSVHEAGLPEGVLSILPADRETSEHLVAHPDVDKIAFTGSTRRGPAHRVDRRRAAQAGQPGAGRQVRGDHPRRRGLSTRPCAGCGSGRWPTTARRASCRPASWRRAAATTRWSSALKDMVER